MDLINCKKKKGAKMPYQCEICENMYAVRIKEGRDISDCTKNKCYKERVWHHNGKSKVDKYKPYTNSKKEIELTCSEFSHMRILKCK